MNIGYHGSSETIEENHMTNEYAAAIAAHDEAFAKFAAVRNLHRDGKISATAFVAARAEFAVATAAFDEAFAKVS